MVSYYEGIARMLRGDLHIRTHLFFDALYFQLFQVEHVCHKAGLDARSLLENRTVWLQMVFCICVNTLVATTIMYIYCIYMYYIYIYIYCLSV